VNSTCRVAYKRIFSERALADETVSVRLSLWNGQIGKVRVDVVVDIKDCYIANFAGELQLRIGRTETISVVV
jgi:ssDNA-binding replication factor A large subunit